MEPKINEIVSGIRLPEIPSREFPVTCSPGDDIYPALQNALAQCAAHGGGRIMLPPGSFRCGGPVILFAHTELHLADSTCLKFTPSPQAYLPPVFTRWEGIELYNFCPMIYANGITDAAITGQGVISGGWETFGQWRPRQAAAQQRIRSFAEQGIPAERRIMTPEDFLRPAFVQFMNCERILIDGPTFLSTAFWMIHPVYCRHVTVRRIHLDSMVVNNDGIDVDSCEDVLIEDSTFRTGDDAVVIKSGRDQDGLRIARPSRRAVFRNCTIFEALHGFAVGSELSGGAEDIYVQNITMKTIFSLAVSFKSMQGRGGVIRNIHIRDISVEHAGDHLLMMTTDYNPDIHGTALTLFDRITLSHIRCGYAGNAFAFIGHRERPLGRILLQDIAVRHADKVFSRLEYAGNVSAEQVTVNSIPVSLPETGERD